ncbi:hypothetical protein Pan241w_19380 [Gimesia alba]|uniref:Lipoprotein n=1 Tax=Gimesia alba TaxID=2527973 RepID=A0A517RDB5_9PLAN|nr:hypothetical protein [Gimesia alba]QDT41870.1 hypothetical protein Pan241w_19380 [Gimesia alba]
MKSRARLLLLITLIPIAGCAAAASPAFQAVVVEIGSEAAHMGWDAFVNQVRMHKFGDQSLAKVIRPEYVDVDPQDQLLGTLNKPVRVIVNIDGNPRTIAVNNAHVFRPFPEADWTLVSEDVAKIEQELGLSYWQGSIQSSNRAQQVDLELRVIQEGKRILGTVAYPTLGNAAAKVKGTIDDDGKVEFEAYSTLRSSKYVKFPCVYSGKLNEGEMKGVWTTDGAKRELKGRFTLHHIEKQTEVREIDLAKEKQEPSPANSQ